MKASFGLTELISSELLASSQWLTGNRLLKELNDLMWKVQQSWSSQL